MKTSVCHHLLRLAAVVLVPVALVRPPALGQNLWWDADSTGPVSGGEGVWVNGGAGWSISPITYTAQAWSNAVPTTASFVGNSSNTLALSGTIALNGGLFAGAGSDVLITGSTLQLTVSVIPTWETATGSSVVVEAGIGGTGGLAKTGLGQLSLSGSAGHFLPLGTLVHQGFLSLNSTFPLNVTTPMLVIGTSTSSAVVEYGNAHQFATPTQVQFLASGTSSTMKLNGFDQTVGAIVSGAYGDGAIFNGGTASAALTVNTGTASTFSGVIADGGPAGLGLVKTGTGQLRLSGSSAQFTGPTQVVQGYLSLNLTTSFAPTNLLIGMVSGTAPARVVAEQDIVAPSTTVTFFNGTGIHGGTLLLNMTTSIFDKLVSYAPGDGVVENGGFAPCTITLSPVGSGTFSGIIRDGAGPSGPLSLVIDGPGEQWLSGTLGNTFTGSTTVYRGFLSLNRTMMPGNFALAPMIAVGGSQDGATLRFHQAHQVSPSSAITLHGSGASAGVIELLGTVQHAGSVTSGSFGSGIIRNGGSTEAELILDSSGTHEFSGVIEDGGPAPLKLTVNPTQTGTLRLSGSAAQFTGPTQVVQGYLSLNLTTSFAPTNLLIGMVSGTAPARVVAEQDIVAPSTTVTFFNGTGIHGGTLLLNMTTSIFDKLVSYAPGDGVVENGGFAPCTITLSPVGSGTFSGIIRDGAGPSGPLSLVIDGPGEQWLSGTLGNTFTGSTTVYRGFLSLNRTMMPGNFALAPMIAVGGSQDGATLRFHQAHQVSPSSAITLHGSGASAGVIELLGTVQHAGSVTSGSFGSGIIRNGGSTEAELILDSSGTHEFSGVIEDGGPAPLKLTVNPTQTGTLRLSGSAAQFTGPTQVLQGFFSLNLTTSFAPTNLLIGMVSGTAPARVVAEQDIVAPSTTVTFFNGTGIHGGTFLLNMTTSIFDKLVSYAPGDGVVENGGFTPCTITLSPVGSGTFSGIIRDGAGPSGPLSLVIDGPGEQWLSGTLGNTFTGSTAVLRGFLSLNRTMMPGDFALAPMIAVGGSQDGATLRFHQAHQVSPSSAITLHGSGASAGVIELLGTVQHAGSVTSGSFGSGIIRNGGSTEAELILDSSGTHEFSGVIEDGGPAPLKLTVNPTQTGTLRLSGNADNAFTGLTHVRRGMLALNSTFIHTLGPILIGTGTTQATVRVEQPADISSSPIRFLGTGVHAGILSLNQSLTVQSLESLTFGSGEIVAGSVIPSTITLTVQASGTSTFSGRISESGGATLDFVKTGAGIQRLSGTVANAFSGSTMVLGGALHLNHTVALNAVPTPTLTVDSGSVVLENHEQISDSCTVILDYGTFVMSTFSETIGLLQIGNSSTVDLGGSNSILTASAFSVSNGWLTIRGWNGTPGLGLGTTQFRTLALPTQFALDSIEFYDASDLWLGAGAIALDRGGYYEIVAIPEPGAALFAALGAALYALRRRRAGG